MNNIIILSITFLLFGCSSYQEITEQDVKDTILGLFDSFSVESSDKSNLYNFVTDDLDSILENKFKIPLITINKP